MKHYFKLALLFLITMVASFTVNAQTDYTLTDDDVVVVDGIIQSCSYTFSGSTNLTIPETLDGQSVIEIGDASNSNIGVFHQKGIINLVLPSTLQTIGSYAFNGNKIVNLNLSTCTSLETIGKYSFYRNIISSIDLSGCMALKTISNSAFAYNYNIESLDFSACTSLVTIGSSTFKENLMTKVDLSPCTSLESISSFAFSYNAIDSLYFTGCTALTTISSYSFHSNQLDTIDLSSCTALTTIGTSAFSTNTLLDTIDLTPCIALVSIGTHVFNNTNIKSFNLPIVNTINNIEGFVFNNWLSSSDEIYNNGDNTTDLLNSYEAQFSAYTLNDDDVVVEDGVIISCNRNLFNSALIIPEILDNQTIVGIGNSNLGASVFSNKNIKAVNLPNTIQSFGSYSFAYNDIRSLDLTACTQLTSIGDRAFNNNDIDSLDLSQCNLLNNIGEATFYYNSISYLDLSSCSFLTTIDRYAFSSNNIDSLDLSSCTALRTIGSDAFTSNNIDSLDLSFCTALNSIGTSAFKYNELDTIDLSACKALTYIGYDAFKDNNFSDYALPTPSVKGYEFNNWVDRNDSIYAGGEIVSTITAVFSGITYEASLSANDYEIVFDANGGEAIMPNQTIKYRDKALLNLNTYTHTNATFIAWNSEADGLGDSYNNEAEFTMNTEGVTLYAQWGDKTSITSTEATNNIKLYPNPSSEFITLEEVANSDIYIYNATGTLVKRTHASETTQVINISTLSAGLYFVKVNNYTQSIVIE